MSKIRIDLEATLINGQSLTFQSPADCSQITGLIVYYPEGNGTTSKDFKFVDAHGVDVGSSTISLFAENVLVKVILDTDQGKAYVQNADTNAYLEGRFLTDADGIMQKIMKMLKGDTNTGIENGEGNKIFGYGTDGDFRVGDSAFPLAFFGNGAIPTYNGNNLQFMQTGTYVGTGTCGHTAPNSLTFEHAPKLVIICGSNGDGVAFFFAVSPYERGYTIGSFLNTTGYQNITWNDRTMQWYRNTSDKSSANQLNASGLTYRYFAFV